MNKKQKEFWEDLLLFVYLLLFGIAAIADRFYGRALYSDDVQRWVSIVLGVCAISIVWTLFRHDRFIFVSLLVLIVFGFFLFL